LLALDRRRGLAGQRGQPAQQLGEQVKPALLALGQRRVVAERGSGFVRENRPQLFVTGDRTRVLGVVDVRQL
jgi:hypothetical protein